MLNNVTRVISAKILNTYEDFFLKTVELEDISL